MKHKKRSQFLLVALVALAGLIFASNAMADTTPTLSNPYRSKTRVVPNGMTLSACVTVTSQAGENITVGFGAQYGKFAQHDSSFISDGLNVVCSIYTAPKNRALVGKTEIITFTVIDDDTGVPGKAITNSFLFKHRKCR